MSVAAQSLLKEIKVISPENAEAIAEHLIKFGHPIYKPLRYLGSGRSAIVFWLANRKVVFKITSDPSDATGLTHLWLKPLRGFVKVLDVFSFKNKGKKFYGIVTEKLQELSPSEKSKWNSFFRILDNRKSTGESIPTFRALQDKSLGIDYMEELGLSGRWIRLFNKAVLESPDFKEALKGYDKQIKAMELWANGLDTLGLHWKDLHDENILVRGRDYIIADLGASLVVPLEPPILAK